MLSLSLILSLLLSVVVVDVHDVLGSVPAGFVPGSSMPAGSVPTLCLLVSTSCLLVPNLCLLVPELCLLVPELCLLVPRRDFVPGRCDVFVPVMLTVGVQSATYLGGSARLRSRSTIV
jgi:hypothetical protein